MKSEEPQPDPVRVLLVDDEPLVRRVVRLLLESQGFIVEEAPSVQLAFSLFCDAKKRQKQSSTTKGVEFDVVLTDVQMPQESGFAFSRRLKAENPNIRMLFMSGSGLDACDDDVTEHEEVADWQILRKPLQAASLANAIEHLLSSRGP